MCSKIKGIAEKTGRIKKKKRWVQNPKKKLISESTNDTPSNVLPSHKKIRSRTRKPKFLSLTLQLTTSDDDKKPRKHNNTTSEIEKKEQLDLFPLHPEDLSEREAYGAYQCDAVTAYLFNSATDSTISSIHDLLDSSAGDTSTVSDCGARILSPYDQREHGPSPSSSLVRTAMKRGASEEEEAEERWVNYSEVVEEVMSRSGTPRWCGGGEDVEEEECGRGGRAWLGLKLDYEQIMEAWSDKGPLYVDGEPPQTVPDLHAHHEGWGRRREASLLRYKEKRQRRLFSKRIRYHVRKLNAQQRPRLKGRFVKRADT